jgi:hypothetical protein
MFKNVPTKSLDETWAILEVIVLCPLHNRHATPPAYMSRTSALPFMDYVYGTYRIVRIVHNPHTHTFLSSNIAHRTRHGMCGPSAGGEAGVRADHRAQR